MEYIIRLGDTLSEIADRFGVTVDAILAANPDITDPDLIEVGQSIWIPIQAAQQAEAQEVYIVQSGDSLYKIAARFGLTLQQLVAANPQIANPNLIFPGQTINIPAGTFFNYTVQAGDTLYRIAKRFNTNVGAIIRINPGINPNLIYPDQQIRIPGSQPSETPPGCLAFISDRSGRFEVWRSDPTGTNPIQMTAPPETPDQPVREPHWSPDGKWIAYISGSQLAIVDSCGGNGRSLVKDAVHFSWSNDGSQIAYSNESGSFIVDLNGVSRPLSSQLFRPVWFPGDQRLAGYTNVEGLNYSVLAAVDASGANFKVYDREPLIPASIVALSPDGRYAATFLFQGSAYSLVSGVAIFDFATNRVIPLPGQEIQSEGRTVNLSFLGGWAPDSSRLVYSTMMALNGLTEIRIANLQGAIVQRFSQGYYPEVGWGPTVDWLILAGSKTAGQGPLDVPLPRNIIIHNLRTEVETKVTRQGDNFQPDWNAKPCRPCY